MNISVKVENQPSKFDVFKWLIVAVLLAGGITANSYFAAQPMAIRITGWVILSCLAILIAFQTKTGKKVWEFFQEARTELRKVVWPTRQETIQTTLLVVAMVIITALLLWAIDSFLLWAVSFLTV